MNALRTKHHSSLSSMAAPAALVPILSLLLLLLQHVPPASAQLTAFSAADSPWRASDNRTLVSPNRTFAAGFRASPRSPSLFLFSIWVRNAFHRTVVWSLDPDHPVPPSANLSISPLGVLSLENTTIAVGDSNSSQLLLKEDGSLAFGNWTSFANLTNTILPNQNLSHQPNGVSLRSASGRYRLVNGTTLVLNSNDTYWTIDGNNAIHSLNSSGALLLDNSAVLIASDMGKNSLRRLTIGDDGNLRVYSLNSTSGRWKVVWQAVLEVCTILGACAPGSICVPNGDATVPTCACPPGFRNATDGTACVRKASYASGGKFLRLDFVKFIHRPNTADLSPLDFGLCQSRCLANSSCVGFTYKFDGQQNCVHYTGNLSYGYWSPATEVAMFLRVASSETDAFNYTGMVSTIDTVCLAGIDLPLPPKQSKTTARNLSIIVVLFVFELFVGVFSFCAFLKRYSKYRDMARTFGFEFLPAGGPKRFTYAEIRAATDDFSHIVGHGGFGEVYKGMLPDGRVIAVKRLKNVSHGEASFWAEVTIIARMHHLNLVRMWGFCADKGHRMLVYEYIPNGSLDKYLFDPSKADKESRDARSLLDWNIRYRIAVGVARAIAYLHEACLEWVLHCDIKPENILLEEDFCPKVSDFGLSKLVSKEDKVSMSRIRGTRGYMAPEWVIKNEPITAKADVYSFGMVLLEIVSGIRSSEFQRASVESEDWYFPRWTYEKVYEEKKVEDVLDERIREMYDDREHFAMIHRMVKTAMWCLQDRVESRPSMGKVAKMLEGMVEIMEPKKPTIFYLTAE